MHVSFGKPVVYLCNDDPREFMTQHEEDYYKLNCVYVLLGENDLFF